MLLTRKQSTKVASKTGSEALAKDSSSSRKLTKIFGAHTFFKSDKGLFIVQPTVDPERPERTLVRRIRLADWADSEKTSLIPLSNKLSETTITL